MLGRSRSAKTQQLAEDAWDALVATWDSAREHTGDLVDGTQDRLGSLRGSVAGETRKITKEAGRRASDAFDALAGRRSGTSWGIVLGAVAAGVFIGVAAAIALKRGPDLPTLLGTNDIDAVEAGHTAHPGDTTAGD
jgi:hypothetical protein